MFNFISRISSSTSRSVNGATSTSRQSQTFGGKEQRLDGLEPCIFSSPSEPTSIPSRMNSARVGTPILPESLLRSRHTRMIAAAARIYPDILDSCRKNYRGLQFCRKRSFRADAVSHPDFALTGALLAGAVIFPVAALATPDAPPPLFWGRSRAERPGHLHWPQAFFPDFRSVPTADGPFWGRYPAGGPALN